jgi:hypothetical protein
LLLNLGESSFCFLHMSWFLFLLAYMGLQSLSGENDTLRVVELPSNLAEFSGIASTNHICRAQ